MAEIIDFISHEAHQRSEDLRVRAATPTGTLAQLRDKARFLERYSSLAEALHPFAQVVVDIEALAAAG